VFLAAVVAFLCTPPGAVIHAEEEVIPVSDSSDARVGTDESVVEELVESGQWTPEAREVLAQALWGEAGILASYARDEAGRPVPCSESGDCRPNADWDLIPWILAERWGEMRERGRSTQFAALVRAYCASVKPRLASDAAYDAARTSLDRRRVMRRRMITSVRWDGSNLLSLRREYRRGVPIRIWREGWSRITETVEAFGRGDVPRSCPDAEHWDAVGTVPSWGEPVDCGDTLNAFYRVRASPS
jgi:hypothetical protein